MGKTIRSARRGNMSMKDMIKDAFGDPTLDLTRDGHPWLSHADQDEMRSQRRRQRKNDRQILKGILRGDLDPDDVVYADRRHDAYSLPSW